jgi:hypothetical protein
MNFRIITLLTILLIVSSCSMREVDTSSLKIKFNNSLTANSKNLLVHRSFDNGESLTIGSHYCYATTIELLDAPGANECYDATGTVFHKPSSSMVVA